MTKLSVTKLLSAIDIITLAYCGWILALMAIGINRVIDAHVQIPIYLSVVGLILLMALWHRNLDAIRYPRLYKGLRLLRALYPILLFEHFFTSGYAFNRILFTEWLDPFFMNIDQAIFGYLPSMEWGIHYDHWLISELFHFAYFCYYPMIIGLPLYLYFKNPKGFKEIIFNLCFVFYLCYFVFSLIPVIGGRYLHEAMELTRLYRAGPFTHIMVYIYRNTHHLGGAFPSSHVAIALVLTIGALRYVRPLGYLFVIISVFLSLATVYCHYHWFIDAVMGVFAGLGGYYLANYTHRKLQGAL
jgi:membrane-associated phospholipid phosphatase